MEHCPICNNTFKTSDFGKHIHGCYQQDCKSRGYSINSITTVFTLRFISNCTCTNCRLSDKSNELPSSEDVELSHSAKKTRMNQAYSFENHFDQLPAPLMQTIFSYFNNYDHFVVSLVCKQWNSLVVRNQSLSSINIFSYFSEIGSLSVLKWLRFQTSL